MLRFLFYYGLVDRYSGIREYLGEEGGEEGERERGGRRKGK